MTFSQDEIIAMAEPIAICSSNDSKEFDHAGLVQFATLVAAKEREACAKVCDELAELNRTAPTDSMWQWGECAAAIRARGQKEGA